MIKAGDYILVHVDEVSPRSLYCTALGKMNIKDYDTMMKKYHHVSV